MIAILGGGISGLAAAFELHKAGKDFVLLEADNQLGGKIKSQNINGFQLEMGPNTVLINNREIKELIQELDLNEQIILPDDEAVKNRFVIKNGQIEQIPNSFSSAFQSNLFGLSTLYHILSEPFRKADRNTEDESLANFSRRRFGTQIYRDFITPFVSGIYAGDPEKMSINHTLSILKEAESKHGSILKGMVKIMKAKKQDPENQNLPKQKIFTLTKGLGAIIESIEKQIENRIKLNATINAIVKDKESGSYQINYKQGDKNKQLVVDQIISSIPAMHLAECIRPMDSSLADQLNKINYVPAVVLHLSIDKAEVKFKQKAFGLLSRKSENVPFLGVLFNSRFFPHTAPDNKELLTIICGGYKQANILQEDVKHIHRAIDQSLNSLLGLSSTSELLHVQKWPRGIPQYELGYGSIKKSIEGFQAQQKNFYIASNFFGGISVSDCISNARRTARKLI